MISQVAHRTYQSVDLISLFSLTSLRSWPRIFKVLREDPFQASRKPMTVENFFYLLRKTLERNQNNENALYTHLLKL